MSGLGAQLDCACLIGVGDVIGGAPGAPYFHRLKAGSFGTSIRAIREIRGKKLLVLTSSPGAESRWP